MHDQVLPEYIEQERDNPSFPYTTEQKWIDWNAPDEAFGMILKWARSAKADNYSFYPRGCGMGKSPPIQFQTQTPQPCHFSPRQQSIHPAYSPGGMDGTTPWTPLWPIGKPVHGQ
jgi:hypothetical protein